MRFFHELLHEVLHEMLPERDVRHNLYRQNAL
jgi:hypothetical protein